MTKCCFFVSVDEDWPTFFSRSHPNPVIENDEWKTVLKQMRNFLKIFALQEIRATDEKSRRGEYCCKEASGSVLLSSHHAKGLIDPPPSSTKNIADAAI